MGGIHPFPSNFEFSWEEKKKGRGGQAEESGQIVGKVRNRWDGREKRSVTVTYAGVLNRKREAQDKVTRIGYKTPRRDDTVTFQEALPFDPHILSHSPIVPPFLNIIVFPFHPQALSSSHTSSLSPSPSLFPISTIRWTLSISTPSPHPHISARPLPAHRPLVLPSLLTRPLPLLTSK